MRMLLDPAVEDFIEKCEDYDVETCTKCIHESDCAEYTRSKLDEADPHP